MDNQLRDLGRVKEILAGAPRGMTIIDVSERMGVNRNSVAKYLEVLRTAGEVEMKSFGRSRIYSLSNRMPLATALSLSSDLIVLIGGDLQIVDANDQFLRFTGLAKGDIVGHALGNIRAEILAHPSILLNIKDALNGKEYAHEISVAAGKEEQHFKIKLIPVAVSDAQRRVAVVYENITARKRAEIALRESEARYRAVVEEQTELICRILPDSTLTFVNDAWCRFFRRSREEILGSKYLDIVPAGYGDSLRADLENIRPGHPSETVERDITLPGGRTYWIQSTYLGRFDGKGRLAEIQVVARDITGRREAEIALRESEERFRAAFDQSPIGACIATLEFRFLRVNPEFCRITGYRENELQSMTFLELTHPDDREADARLAGDLVAGCIEEYHIEKRCLTKDGRVIWLRKHARLLKDLHGRPLYFLPMFEDITAKKHMEESLKITQLSVDMAVDEVNWVSPDGRLLYVNEASCRKLGYSRDELLGMHIWDIDMRITPEGLPAIMEAMRRAGHVNGESVRRTRDGTEYPVDVNATFLPLGDWMCMCAYVRDITDRKAMESSLKLTQFAMDNAMEGIIWVDCIGRLIYVNHAVTAKLKYSREELLRMKIWEINPTYDPGKWQERYEDSKKDGHSLYESIHRSRDGEIIPVEISVSSLRFDDREYFCANVRDISRRKRVERALQAREEGFRNIFDQSPIGICELALDFRLLKVNPELCRITGYTEGELTGRNFLDIIFPDDCQALPDMDAAIAMRRNEHYHSDKRIVCKNGQIIWVKIVGSFIRDPSGSPLYMIGLIENITERKRLEESLRIAQLSVDRSVDGIHWVHPDGRIAYVNDAVCRKLGYSREELLAMYVWDIDPLLEPRRYWSLMDEIRKYGHREFESLHRNRDGQTFPVEITAVYMPHGAGEYLCAYVRDISARKRNEASLEMYRFTIGHVSDAICWLRPDGRFVEVNDALCRMTGYARDELLARDIFGMSPQMDRNDWPQRIDRIRKNGPLRVEMVWAAADGTGIPVEFSLIWLSFGGGEYLCVIGRPIVESSRAAGILEAKTVYYSKFPARPEIP